MKIEEIEQEAMALTENQRFTLASKLLDSLPPAGEDVPDEEIERRENDLAGGKVAPISHDEFVRRVEQNRGR